MAKNEQHIQIVDKENGITLQILYGEISSFEIRDDPKSKKPSDKDFFADNEEFIEAIYRVFKKAEDLGYFRGGHLRKDEDGENYVEITV